MWSNFGHRRVSCDGSRIKGNSVVIHLGEKRPFRRSSVEQAGRKALDVMIIFWCSTRNSGCTIVAQMVPSRVVLHKHRPSHRWFLSRCQVGRSLPTSRLLRTHTHPGTRIPSGWPTIRGFGVLRSVSAAASACHQHTSYVLLSMHSVIEDLRGAS